MRARVVSAIVRRELRDMLRDRRTLFTTLVLPLVLYPALMLGFSAFGLSERKDVRRAQVDVAVRVGDVPLLREAAAARPASELLRDLLDREQFTFREVPDGATAVESGAVALFARIPPAFDERLARREPVSIDVRYRSNDPYSRAALDTFRGVVDRHRTRLLPLEVSEMDAATQEQRGGYLFGGIIAMIVVIMALTGAFYPALDLVAGEKERGTLEALLLSPATRRELVAGKYLTVLIVAVASSLANLASMALTFQGLGNLLAGAGAAAGGAPFSVRLTAGGVAAITVVLILMSGLFSALTLALSTFARTYKEAQAYLTPLFLIVTPLSMVATMPTLTIEKLAWVPIANVTLLFKKLLMGEFPAVAAGQTALSLLVLALASLQWTVSLFSREDVIFRDGKSTFSVRRIALAEQPGSAPAGLSLFAVLVAITLTFHVAAPLMVRSPVLAFLVQMGMFAAVPLALGRLAQLRTAEVFGFARLRGRDVLAGVIAAGGGVAAALALVALAGPGDGGAERLQKALAPLLEQPPWVLFILVAAVGPIAEEVLFRGFLLSGLSSAMPAAAAVGASAAIFGLCHFEAARLPQLVLLGAVLGALRIAARSIWPGMIAHVLINASAAWSALGPNPGALDSAPTTAASAGLHAAQLAGGLVLCVLAVRVARRQLARG